MRIGETAILTALMLFPSVLHAQVTISEVAWAGSAGDANNEWIELYNAGSGSIDLSGWRLAASDGSPSIALSGSIASMGYFLLERTDDDSVLGVTADQIYTGALANEGEQLQLFNAGGTSVDRVDGSGGWAIGGDSGSKATLQKINGAWGTAEGTPRRANATASAAPNTTSSSKTKTTSTKARPVITGGTKDALPTPTHRSMVAVDIGTDQTGTVGAMVSLTATVLDDDGSELQNGAIRWTFGDGATGEGKNVTHTYQHSGAYVVTAHLVYVEFRRTFEDSARITVTITAPSIGIPSATPSFIEVANYGSTEADLSKFKLVSGMKAFIMPPDSFILPGSSIRIPSSVSGLRPQSTAAVTVYFPGGGVVALSKPPVPVVEKEEETPAAPIVQLAQSIPKQVAPPEAVPVEDEISNNAEVSSLTAAPMFATEDAPTENPSWWWGMMLFTIIGIGMTAMVFVRKEGDETMALARQFTIIDDSEDKP